MHAAFPPYSDDNHGGAVWSASPRVWNGNRVGASPPARHHHCWRIALKSTNHALHDPSRLSDTGSLAAALMGRENRQYADGQRGLRITMSTSPERRSRPCAISLCLAFGLTMAGCMVGPKYHAPTPPAPTAQNYKESTANFQDTQGWKVASPQEAMLRGKWWEVFNDAELNAL